MWLGLVTMALAGPSGDPTSGFAETSTPGCEPPDLQGLVPEPNAVDVPLDAIVTMLVNESASACGVSSVIADDHGVVVPSTVEVLGDKLRVRPEGLLLPDRTYDVVVNFATGSIYTAFSTVDELARPLAEPTDVAIDAGATCGSSFEISASASATLEGEDVGLFSLAVTGGYWDVEVDHAVASGPVSLGGVAYNVPDACVSLRLYDVTGGLAWESEPECLGETACPVPAPLETFELTAQRSCETGTGETLATVTVAMPAEPAGAGGLLVADLETERGTARSGLSHWTPGETLDLFVVAAGDRDACATVTYIDVWGNEAWTSPEVCAPVGDGCPWGDDLDGVGSGCGGCATGSGAGGLLPLAVLLAVGHRRRRGD